MSLVKLIEPPCTERYARWCERSGNHSDFPPTRSCGLRPDSRIGMRISDSKLTTDQTLLALVADNTRAIAWLNSSDGAKGINRPKSLVEALIGERNIQESGIETFETGQDFDDEWRRLTGGEK